jgi:hydrogenase expression/formation protein HypD
VRYLDEFRDAHLVEALARKLSEWPGERSPKSSTTLMEVCGTHTMAIARHGLRQFLPKGVRLVSGPGCPVCVTSQKRIDEFLALGDGHVIKATFGDLVRVPGSTSSLEAERARGADVRVVYSPVDALTIAKQTPGKQVVFFAVGFETTAPGVAASVLEAERERVGNYSVFSAHKVVPPALETLVSSGPEPGSGIGGFILPGHVSTIIGATAYEFLAREHGVPCVVTGFEPTDILQGILMLLRQRLEGRAEVEIQYSRAVNWDGNPRARQVTDRVFQVCDAEWRGLGRIPLSGLALREEFSGFDAERRFPVEAPVLEEPAGNQVRCLCGLILQGRAVPEDCPLFGRVCTPASPVGPCMVSSEGTCAAWYRYPPVRRIEA